MQPSLLLLVVLFPSVVQFVTAFPTSFFVSTNGSDQNSGLSPKSAFLTPGRACIAIEALRGDTGNETLPSNIQVRLLDGLYFLPKPLSINPACSGDANHSVTWLADSGIPGRVQLSGGSPVTGWLPAPDLPGVFFTTLSRDTFPQVFVRQLFAINAGTGVSERRMLASTPLQQYLNISYGSRNATVWLPPGALGNYSAAALSGAFIQLYHTWTTSISPVTLWDPINGVIETTWTSNTGACGYC